MKKNTLFSIFFFLITVSVTAQIDIVNSELDIQVGTQIQRRLGIRVAEAPTHGDFQIWDYTNSTFSAPYSFLQDTFYENTNPTFPNADFYNTGSATVGYYLFTNTKDYHAKNNQFFGTIGREIIGKRFELSALTGSPSDSAIISNYTELYPQPVVEYDFPVTANKTWTSNTQMNTPFELKLPSLFIPYAPSLVTTYLVRTDSIVGWGILKIRDPQNSSNTLEIQVLLNKSAQTRTDSIFVGGMPAPPMLLGAFNIEQGATFTYTNYYFLAKNMSQPALTLIRNIDSLVLEVAAEIPEAAIDLSDSKPIIQSVADWNIYPNPVKDGYQFSITFDKPNNEDCIFAIYNTAGQQVFMRNINAPQGHFQQNFELSNSTPKGNYFYTLRDQKGNNMAGGVIAVQ